MLSNVENPGRILGTLATVWVRIRYTMAWVYPGMQELVCLLQLIRDVYRTFTIWPLVLEGVCVS
jgi:hypothetical protein